MLAAFGEIFLSFLLSIQGGLVMQRLWTKGSSSVRNLNWLDMLQMAMMPCVCYLYMGLSAKVWLRYRVCIIKFESIFFQYTYIKFGGTGLCVRSLEVFKPLDSTEPLWVWGPSLGQALRDNNWHIYELTDFCAGQKSLCYCPCCVCKCHWVV